MVSHRLLGPTRAALALLVPPIAWFAFEIGLAGALRVDCEAVGRAIGPLWGLASIAACAVAGRIAWGLRSPATDQVDLLDQPSSTFVARLSMMGATLFALAIGLQTLAVLIIPPCAH